MSFERGLKCAAMLAIGVKPLILSEKVSRPSENNLPSRLPILHDAALQTVLHLSNSENEYFAIWKHCGKGPCKCFKPPNVSTTLGGALYVTLKHFRFWFRSLVMLFRRFCILSRFERKMCL